jgi:flavin-dependent dehydrogenase
VEVHLVPGVGELYVTPTGAHQLSLALLAPRPAVSALRGSLPAAVRAASERSPALRARLWGASPLGRATATGPLASRAVRPFAHGALLAGDAALAVDPIGGDGMTLAMLGSAPCADAVRALLAGADPRAVGRRYERALREVSQRRALFVRALLSLAARPALARRVLAGLALAPVAVTALCALHEGSRRRP